MKHSPHILRFSWAQDLSMLGQVTGVTAALQANSSESPLIENIVKDARSSDQSALCSPSTAIRVAAQMTPIGRKRPQTRRRCRSPKQVQLVLYSSWNTPAHTPTIAAGESHPISWLEAAWEKGWRVLLEIPLGGSRGMIQVSKTSESGHLATLSRYIGPPSSCANLTKRTRAKDEEN